MLKEVKQSNIPTVRQNLMDRAVGYFSPVRGAKRLQARMALEIFGSYSGASKTRRSLKEWAPDGLDADSDILSDLPNLRQRSRDLCRNNPLAGGAIKTKVTNVVGTGLRLQARIDRDALGLSDEQADSWELVAERNWRLFWDSKECDVARTLTGTDITRMVYQQAKENGDVFILLPRIKRKGVSYDLKLQIVEADRVCNKDSVMDSDTLAGGIKKDEFGAPVEYHILKNHPGSIMPSREWHVRKAFGESTGLRNVIHFYNPTRPGQSRGVPDLAAVIEPLKQLGRYTDAEIQSAVISAFFTVFIETENGAGGFDYSNLDGETGQQTADKDVKLGSGLIVELAKGEKVHDSNPGRPNPNFDGFVKSILQQVGVGLELPFEILIKHFTASYSASRAALLELWKYVLSERRSLADNFLKIVYEIFMYEAVAAGRIVAPGFLVDPFIRAAYLGCEFVGTSKGQLNELMEVKASQARVDGGFSTLADETAQLTGKDWDRNHKQQVKERKKRLDDGLIDQENSKSLDGSVTPDKTVQDYEGIKGKLDAYGVGVRAGGFTPQLADEEAFRLDIGIPKISDCVKSAWEEDGGFRRPITLSSGQIAVNDDKENPDESGDDNGNTTE